MKKERFLVLLDQYLSDSISPTESDEMFDLLATGQYDEMVGSKILAEIKENRGEPSVIPHDISQGIIRNILESEKNTTDLLPVRKRVVRWGYWVAAACLVLLSSTALYFWNHNSHKASSMAAIMPHGLLYEKNETARPLRLVLPDSSTVILQPQSSLNYPAGFMADKREVYLEGAAFFQVTKNASKPFLVYFDHIVTKVLGTSFNEGINPVSGNIEVSVLTGKVQVFENNALSEKPEAVIVTPNQKAIYKASEREFETAIVEKPLPILSSPRDMFVYDRMKINAILQQISKYYGIDIVVENEVLNNCLFTGDLSSADLFTKLKILTLTINASYEVNGTKILIKGPGCD